MGGVSGWMSRTHVSVRISASASGMQGTPHNEQAGSQNPLALHGFTKFGGPEKGGFGIYKPLLLADYVLIILQSNTELNKQTD